MQNANQVQLRQICNTIGTFDGSVRARRLFPVIRYKNSDIPMISSSKIVDRQKNSFTRKVLFVSVAKKRKVLNALKIRHSVPQLNSTQHHD